MKSRLVLAVLMVSFLGVGVVAKEAKRKHKKINFEDIKCPVSGKAVKEASKAEYEGHDVYFCCGKCIKAFNKEPAKFAAATRLQLVATKQARQVKCPISGKPCKKEIVSKVAGVNVHFCCKHCKAKVDNAASDKEKIELVFNDASFEKGFKFRKPKTKGSGTK